MQLGIPPDALFFCFCHPCIESGVDLEGLSLSDPFVSLLLCGGFLYLNEMYEVVAINAFFFDEVDESQKEDIKKSVIHLGSPTSLDTDCMDHLEKLKQFQPVTVPWLQKLGCKDFAWIPGSELLGTPCQSVFPKAGGFAYRNSKTLPSCFVPIVAAKVDDEENAHRKVKEPEKLRFFRPDGDPLKDANEKGSKLCAGQEVENHHAMMNCVTSEFHFQIRDSTGRVMWCYVENREDGEAWIAKLRSVAKEENRMWDDQYSGALAVTLDQTKAKYEGLVYKRGRRNTDFKERYFMLADGILKYFEKKPGKPLPTFKPRAMGSKE